VTQNIEHLKQWIGRRAGSQAKYDNGALRLSATAEFG